MVGTFDPFRFNKSCLEASFGYASAITAASGIVTEQVCGFWIDSIGLAAPATVKTVEVRKERSARLRRGNVSLTVSHRRESKKRKSARAAARSSKVEEPLALADAMGDMFALPWQMVETMARDSRHDHSKNRSIAPYGTVASGAGPAEVMQAWMDMDLTRSPEAWPMVYSMMSAGVPKGVAWPMAEANLAMLEAFDALGFDTKKMMLDLAASGAEQAMNGFSAQVQREGAKAGAFEIPNLFPNLFPGVAQPSMPFGNLQA